MDFGLILVLALVTFGAVIGFAMWSKGRTEDKLDRDNAPKSSLAKDGPGPNVIQASRNQRTKFGL